MDIKGQDIIITGGASGMGAATARFVAERGARPVLWDMNWKAAQQIAVECKGQAAQVDVTDEASIQAALAQIDTPRGLVNCAGILIGKRIVGREGPADMAHFQKVLAVNLGGSFNTMRLVTDKMSKLDPVNDDGARGVIINTASIAAFEGQIGQAAYSASKGGIVGMTLPAARELAKFGIRVMAIAPGAVSTPMIGEVSQELQQSIAAGIPFPPRMAQPDEFAKLAVHIFENEYLNGTVIRMDGAARLAAQ